MCLDPRTFDNSQKKNIEYELVNAIIAPYAAAEMIPLSTGIISQYTKIKIEAVGKYNDTSRPKPIIAPADHVYPRSKFSPPNILPTRTDEGITRDDVDVGYMSSYNMRLIKIYHKDAELELQNVVLENAGVSDDVDYNPYLAKYLENSPLVVSTSSSSLERILLDPGASSQDSQSMLSASALQNTFCDRPQKSIESIPGGIGKHHGGAIFFSGKLLNCTGCHFRNNRVTGNGGALFVESVQPGRVVIDPDIDFYADDSNYANRIDLQAAGIPELATFRCNGCIFEDNLAMSVSRGP